MRSPAHPLAKLVALGLCAAAGAQDPTPAPAEFGAIAFGRDSARAHAAAKAAALPTLLLFQEVPG